MRTASSPDELRRMIDEALEEIERTELEMLDVLADVLGPQEAQLVADQIAAQEKAERFRRLLQARSVSDEGKEGLSGDAFRE